MKAERKYLATYLDAAFDMTYGKPDYVRLGKDLEEYSEELNPNVDSKNNIIGEKQVNHTGYDISSEASPFYYEYDDALSEKIMDIAMNRLTGDACRTTKVDVLLKPGATANDAPTVISASCSPISASRCALSDASRGYPDTMRSTKVLQ